MTSGKDTTRYDCIILLCGGLVRTPDGAYQPTTYAHSDQFGMLGGHMRVIAATLIILTGHVNTLVVSAGTSEKMKAKFGTDAPTEAQIYKEDFKRTFVSLTSSGEPSKKLPRVLLEDTSPNTASSLRECLVLVRRFNWQSVAVVSANLHIPRVRALTELLLETFPVNSKITFLGAEDVVKSLRPGIYNDEIDHAHTSPEAQKRALSEARGLSDMKEGKYVLSEFQLDNPPAKHIHESP